jgi:hypothetical protein
MLQHGLKPAVATVGGLVPLGGPAAPEPLVLPHTGEACGTLIALHQHQHQHQQQEHKRMFSSSKTQGMPGRSV